MMHIRYSIKTKMAARTIADTEYFIYDYGLFMILLCFFFVLTDEVLHLLFRFLANVATINSVSQ